LKLSIRVKFFFWIATLILLFVTISFFLNTILFKPYYLSRQERNFHELCYQLSLLYQRNQESFLREIKYVQYKEGFAISVHDKSNGEYKPIMNLIQPQRTLPSGPDMMDNAENILTNHRAVPPIRIPEKIITEIDQLNEDKRYIFRTIRDYNNIPMLSMFYVVEDGIILFISRPMESIDESMAISARFSLLTGLCLLFIGTIAALLLTKYVTDPINELKSIAESMAKLDFSKKYHVRNNDEIGDLGHSINSLSHQLNEAISHLNHLNSDLLMEIEKERKIDEMRQNFIANVSHELRTPISIIEGYAEGLIDNIADDRKRRTSYCQVIMDETRKMEKHVKDLLLLSQFQAGVLQPDYSRFDINKLTEQVINKFKESGSGEYINQSQIPSLFVRADKGSTEQILNNYIKNALRYGDGKKPISLTTEQGDKGKVRLSVYNSGVRINEEDLERIWESYYKVDKARTRELGGCGLGLSIVKAIMDQHNNRYGAENKPDGVLFWFELDEA
jgi:two-component system, OmpR family, sensor histidine kinase VanS